MNLIEFPSPDALQKGLGEQVRRLRLARDLDQLSLADRAGVSEKALRNLEAGKGSTLATLVQVIRALGATEWLGSLAPAASISPMALLQQQPRPRRVSRPRARRAQPP